VAAAVTNPEACQEAESADEQKAKKQACQQHRSQRQLPVAPFARGRKFVFFMHFDHCLLTGSPRNYLRIFPQAAAKFFSAKKYCGFFSEVETIFNPRASI
jgi:hypothetical protein